jgi:hypothetical protein
VVAKCDCDCDCGSAGFPNWGTLVVGEESCACSGYCL